MVLKREDAERRVENCSVGQAGDDLRVSALSDDRSDTRFRVVLNRAEACRLVLNVEADLRMSLSREKCDESHKQDVLECVVHKWMIEFWLVHNLVPRSDAKYGHIRRENVVLIGGSCCFPDVPRWLTLVAVLFVLMKT